ncbi:unnamed protein product [Thelazia callipaeda]|uniref:Tudor domain-containing protein n=1 Tax=Thelazia callipaeda TaxID=103827 RepID=A0A0N5CNR3_THECL|nr:unnamed protein product [Thelazia callipaeda]
MARKNVSSPVVIGTAERITSLTFKPFKAKLTHKLNARVTEKLTDNAYLMRDISRLQLLYQHMVQPNKRLSPSLFVNDGCDVACIARVRRPRYSLRNKNRRLYRALVGGFSLKEDNCYAFLVDYGQHVICEPASIFDLCGQVPIIFCIV